MEKCSCFRLSDETKDTLRIIKDHFGLKSTSAVINELFYFVRHGKNYPGSQVDMSQFFGEVLHGNFVVGRETLQERVLARQRELTQQYINVLTEEYGYAILSLIATDGIKKTLDPRKNMWVLNIQHTIMEKCDVGLLESEVRDLCLQWYDAAKIDGTVSKLQKDIISENWSKRNNTETLSHLVGDEAI